MLLGCRMNLLCQTSERLGAEGCLSAAVHARLHQPGSLRGFAPCADLTARPAQASLASLENRLERTRLSLPPITSAKTLLCCELPDAARRAWTAWTVAGALAVRAPAYPQRSPACTQRPSAASSRRAKMSAVWTFHIVKPLDIPCDILTRRDGDGGIGGFLRMCSRKKVCVQALLLLLRVFHVERHCLAQALLALWVTVRLAASVVPAPSRQFATAAPGGAAGPGTQLVSQRGHKRTATV